MDSLTIGVWDYETMNNVFIRVKIHSQERMIDRTIERIEQTKNR